MLVQGVKGGVWDRSCRAHMVLDSIPSIASIIPKMPMMRGSGGTIPWVRGPGTGTYIFASSQNGFWEPSLPLYPACCWKEKPFETSGGSHWIGSSLLLARWCWYCICKLLSALAFWVCSCLFYFVCSFQLATPHICC